MDSDPRILEDAPLNQEAVCNNTDQDNEADRISDLPIDIKCHILSFLPTKYAAGTSILSTKWGNLLPLIPNMNIQLNDTSFIQPELASKIGVVSFKNFVDRLLNVTLHSVVYEPSIYSLCLSCLRYNDGEEIAGWIIAALQLNIKRMDFQISNLMDTNCFFDSLFGANIYSLDLSLGFSENPSEFRFSLPNLKVLSVHYMKSNVLNALLEGCPSLLELGLHLCYCEPDSVLRVCCSSLLKLRLVNGPNFLAGELKLDTPRLQCLRYGGFLPNDLFANTFKFLQAACLNLDKGVSEFPEDVLDQADELIYACSYVEKLWLSQKVISLLDHFAELLPTFPRLFELVLLRIDSYGWELLSRFLDAAPNFKNLISGSGFDEESYEQFKASLETPISVSLTRHGETGFTLEFHREAENGA